MNFWKQLQDLGLPSFTNQYIKWLDINSSHFFSIEIESDLIPFSDQKAMAKKAIETYQESGNFLVYLSSVYFLIENGSDIPIFLTAVMPVVDIKSKKITWTPVDNYYVINSYIYSESRLEIYKEELDNWVENQLIISPDSLTTKSISLYFNLNSKQFIENDTRSIINSNLEFKLFNEFFVDKIKQKNLPIEPEFLDLIHVLPMDNSQAKAIVSAQLDSIVISGPPGTGKSQTIINLALNEINNGKKVAIISQKKAAIEVIIQRLEKLNLSDLAMNCSNQQEAISHIENTVKLIQEEEIQIIEPRFNLIYFQHCIRTLEEYYGAFNSVNQVELKPENFHWKKNSLSTWIYPNELYLGYTLKSIVDRFLDLRTLLISLNIKFDATTFQLLSDLEPILDMLKLVNLEDLNQYLSDKEGKKSIKTIEKEILKLKALKPKESLFSNLSMDKLDYKLNYLKDNRLIAKFFDSKAKLIEKELVQIDSSWLKINIWQQIESIQDAIVFKKYLDQLAILQKEKKELTLDAASTNSIELIVYIDTKIKAKIPTWLFAYKWLIRNEKYNITKKTWTEILEIYQWILSKQTNFNQFSISQFLNDFKAANDDILSISEWEKACSQTQKNYLKSKTKDDFPILKNYNSREIALMARSVRQNYQNYCDYKSAKFNIDFYNQLKLSYKSKLQSRKKEDKISKEKLKKNLIYIQKNWSKKRKSPSLFQYISNLDFDFIQDIKPLFVGTLDQFSQFTPLQSELYDTVIMDESSQIEILDSIPSIYRAKKLIIVGDNKQLTPTRFFRNQAISISHESILELADERLNSYLLNCHFRSKFSNLIQYSNQNFYDNQLISTPNFSKNALEWKYCANGIYHQRRNEVEAISCIENLKLCALNNATKSIGIIAFSIQQKIEIERLLDLELAQNKLLSNWYYLQEKNSEFLFIKSIEQVQGDERDIIIISSAYGRNLEGKFYQFFGPILLYKGQNRLNVLMSRAKEKIIFISSIKSSDIQIKESSSKGLILFKKLFQYLESNQFQSQIKPKFYSNYWEYYLHPFRR